jgi:hypothetical protein
MKSRVEEIYQYNWVCEFCNKESIDEQDIVACEKKHKEDLQLEDKFKDVDSMTSFLAVLKEINPTIDITFSNIYGPHIHDNNIILGNVNFSDQNKRGDNLHNFIEVILKPYGFRVGTGGGGYNRKTGTYNLGYDFNFNLDKFPKLKKAIAKYFDAEKQERDYDLCSSNYDIAKQDYTNNYLSKDKSFKKARKIFKEAEVLFYKTRDEAIEKYNLEYTTANPEREYPDINLEDLYDEIFRTD